MPWAKLDDGYHSHPKVMLAGNAAVGLYSRALSYCGDQLTDGFVPATWARWAGSKRERDRLEEVGLWRRVDGGYLIPDFTEMNPTREEVLEEREKARERMRKLRNKPPRKRPRSPEVRPNVRPNTSGDVRPNNKARSPEQDEMFARSSPEVRRSFGDPDPTQDPNPRTNGPVDSSNLSAVPGEFDTDEPHPADLETSPFAPDLLKEIP